MTADMNESEAHVGRRVSVDGGAAVVARLLSYIGFAPSEAAIRILSLPCRQFDFDHETIL